jgi:hypothetical protein
MRQVCDLLDVGLLDLANDMSSDLPIGGLR